MQETTNSRPQDGTDSADAAAARAFDGETAGQAQINPHIPRTWDPATDHLPGWASDDDAPGWKGDGTAAEMKD